MPAYRFGKHPPKQDYRTLRFKDYVTSSLALPPPSENVLERLKLSVKDPTKLFPMDGNDTLGDCTIAALAHAETTFRGMVGQEKVMARNAVAKLYFHLTNGVDSGLNELDVLNYWQSNRVDDDELIAFVKVDPKNHTHVEQAIHLF